MDIKLMLETLGFDSEKVKTVDDFKTQMDATFTRNANINEDSEPVKKILGRVYSTLETEIKKVAKAKEIDIDFSIPELKDKKVKDKLSYFIDQFEGKNKTIIDDLTAKAGIGNDDKYKELEKKYNSADQKRKDVEALLAQTTGEYNTYKEQSNATIKGVKLNVLKKDALSKIKFKPDITPLERTGYETMLESSYIFDIDENDKPIVKSKEGKLIPSTKVTGAFKTMEEVLEEEAVKNKVYALNPGAQQQGNKPTFQQGQQPQQRQNGQGNRQPAQRVN